jgi:hypothetical protein
LRIISKRVDDFRRILCTRFAVLRPHPFRAGPRFQGVKGSRVQGLVRLWRIRVKRKEIRSDISDQKGLLSRGFFQSADKIVGEQTLAP